MSNSKSAKHVPTAHAAFLECYHCKGYDNMPYNSSCLGQPDKPCFHCYKKISLIMQHSFFKINILLMVEPNTKYLFNGENPLPKLILPQLPQITLTLPKLTRVSDKNPLTLSVSLIWPQWHH